MEDFKCRFLGGGERERVKGLLKVCLITNYMGTIVDLFYFYKGERKTRPGYQERNLLTFGHYR